MCVHCENENPILWKLRRKTCPPFRKIVWPETTLWRGKKRPTFQSMRSRLPALFPHRLFFFLSFFLSHQRRQRSAEMIYDADLAFSLSMCIYVCE